MPVENSEVLRAQVLRVQVAFSTDGLGCHRSSPQEPGQPPQGLHGSQTRTAMQENLAKRCQNEQDLAVVESDFRGSEQSDSYTSLFDQKRSGVECKKFSEVDP